MNREKKNAILALAVCLLPLIAGAILYSRLPERVPTHWGADGEINGWSSRFVGCFVLPGSMFILSLLMPRLMKLDPKYDNMSPALRMIVVWSIPVINIICTGATLSAGMGRHPNVGMIISIAIGVLFIAIGNYLPKTKQSYTMGIKLPWTLDSEENWNMTHRFGGFVWVISGVLSIISAFFKNGIWLMLAAIIAAAIVPTVYSYLLYKKMKNRDSGSQQED